MIFQTLNQLNCFLIFIFCGLVVGLISIIYFLIFLVNFQKKSIKTAIFTFFYAFFSIFFVFLINFFNFGKFSFVLLMSYILGFVWSNYTFKKSVVILEERWYNKISKKLKDFKTRQKEGKLKTNDTNQKN